MNITGSRDGKVFFIDDDKIMIDGKMYYDKSPQNLAKPDAYSLLYDSLPGYDEIDQVANDEANGIDWDSLRYAGIYTDGFIAGAFWMKNKIKK